MSINGFVAWFDEWLLGKHVLNDAGKVVLVGVGKPVLSPLSCVHFETKL